jgi:hypothetical protein
MEVVVCSPRDALRCSSELQDADAAHCKYEAIPRIAIVKLGASVHATRARLGKRAPPSLKAARRHITAIVGALQQECR